MVWVKLTSETIEGTSLAFQGVHHIHSGHRLAACVLRVGHGITDDVLEEHLEDTTGLFIDQSRDTLDTSTTCKSTDGRLGDSLDVVAKDLPVALGSSLSKSLSSFSTSRHGVGCWCSTVWVVRLALQVLTPRIESKSLYGQPRTPGYDPGPTPPRTWIGRMEVAPIKLQYLPLPGSWFGAVEVSGFVDLTSVRSGVGLHAASDWRNVRSPDQTPDRSWLHPGRPPAFSIRLPHPSSAAHARFRTHDPDIVRSRLSSTPHAMRSRCVPGRITSPRFLHQQAFPIVKLDFGASLFPTGWVRYIRANAFIFSIRIAGPSRPRVSSRAPPTTSQHLNHGTYQADRP